MPINRLKKIKIPNLKSLAEDAFDDAQKRLKDAIDLEMNNFEIDARDRDTPEVLEYPFSISTTPHVKFVVSKLMVENKKEASSDVKNFLKGGIFLPIPAMGIQDEVSVGYNVQEVGLITKELAGLASTLKNQGLGAAVKSVSDNPDLYEKIRDKVGVNLAQGLGGISGLNVMGALQLETGMALNPAEAILFDRVAFRQFSFSYKFMPQSQKESQELEKIIRTFKKYSLPSGNMNDSTFLTAPHRWKVEYDSNLNGLPKYDECVLTSVQTVYNESKNIFHTDGYANEINLVLVFRETSVLTSSKF